MADLKRTDSDEAIEAAIAEVQRELMPAGNGEAARMVEMVAVALQVATPNELGMQVYMRILGELPADLLHEATKRVLERHTISKLPTPGEWRQAVADELSNRRADVNRLRHYKGKVQLAEKYYRPRHTASGNTK